MTLVRTRRTGCARALRTLAWGLAALVGGCGGSSTTHPGTPVVTLADTSGDFANYRVAIDSIALTDTSNRVFSALVTIESVDLASLTDLSELLEAPAVPSGTYKSATITLDYTTASIWVNLNGQAVLASALATNGNPMGIATVTINFDPNRPLVITQGKSSRMGIDIDLAASNTIDTTTSPARVTVRPFPVITPAPADATVMRVRGTLVTVQSASSDYVINTRPLTDLVSALGAVSVSTDAQTYFNIEGVAYSGAAGLSAMATLPTGTPCAAYGTLGDLSGITPGFHATAVYVGTSLESPLADRITGVVSSRNGDTLNVRGATYLTRLGTNTFVDNAAVTIGSGTVVSEDGALATGLTAQSISVGQQIAVSGQGATDSAGNISLDATAGQVRLAATRLWGTLSSATAGSATLDVLSLANFAPAAFNFAGTGAAGQNANPSAYLVSTGSLNESAVAANTLLAVDGIVSPFGSAPPDFTATAITPGTASQQRLEIEWINGGATAPFTTISTSGLVVDLNNADLGTLHEIRTGPAALDLKSLPISPVFTITTAGADQSTLQLAVGSATLSTGISVFNDVSGFTSAVSSAFNGTNKIYRLVAVGQYNSGTNTFVASRISVALY